jgi:hypothetical protein
MHLKIEKMMNIITAGPKEPAYPAVCCEEFKPDQVCDGNVGNILEAKTDVPDIQQCQGLCQVKFVMGLWATFLRLRLMFQTFSFVKGCVRQSL